MKAKILTESRTKSLKEREIRQDNRTFKEIVEEIHKNIEVMAETYVPDLCVALKRERPLISGVEIRARVISAVAKPNGPWKESTIRRHWPGWLKNPNAVMSGQHSAMQVKAQKKEKSELESKFVPQTDEQDREEEQSPIESTPKWDYEEEHPKTEESPFEAIGEINRSIARLWTALTGKKNMAHMEDDIKKEHIIPTRERFKDIMNGSSKVERDFLYNWMTWLDQVIHDRLAIIEKSDSTAYDTRK